MRTSYAITGRTAAIVVIVVIIVAGLAYYATTSPGAPTSSTSTTSSTTSSSSRSSTSSSVTSASTTSTTPPSYTFTILNLVGSSGLDPQFAIEPTIMGNMYERLVVVGLNGTILPDLATSWSVSPNGTQWTFHLRQGVKFHDGTTFNATDVKFSLDRLKGIPLGQGTLKAVISSVVVVDANTVAINTPKPTPLPLYLASEASPWIVTPNALHLAGISPSGNYTKDQLALKAWFDAGNDDGTGPYKVVPSLYNAQSSVVLTRFNDYWGGWKSNQASTVIFNVVNTGTLAMQEMAAGQASFFGSPTVDQINALGSGAQARAITATNVAVQMFWYNVNSSKLQNPQLRAALAYAIPYQTIISNVYGGYASPAVGWIAPGVFGHDSSASSFSYNLTKAHDLLVQAGYSGGVVSPSISLTVLLFSLYPETFQTWSIIQSEWANLGVNLVIESVGPSQLIGIIKGANPPDIVGLRWSPSCLSAGCPLGDNWGSTSFVNFANFKNSTFDSLIANAVSVEGSNPTMSLSLFSQAQALLYQQVPGVVMVNLKSLFVLNNQWSTNPNAQAVDPNPISNTIYVYGFVHS